MRGLKLANPPYGPYDREIKYCLALHDKQMPMLGIALDCGHMVMLGGMELLKSEWARATSADWIGGRIRCEVCVVRGN
jgi:hypothetical protein